MKFNPGTVQSCSYAYNTAYKSAVTRGLGPVAAEAEGIVAVLTLLAVGARRKGYDPKHKPCEWERVRQILDMEEER